MNPSLTYFCELDAQPLQDLFSDPQVTQFLVDTRAEVSMGMRDLSEERAEVVHQLNRASVPITAWLLLPEEQGYWFNLDNAAQAAEFLEEFLDWSRQHNLRWDRIGLDIEPNIQAIQSLTRSRLDIALRGLRRAFDRGRLRTGRKIYQDMVGRLHADGYMVEAYHFPFILDERTARSSVLQRLTGLVDLPDVDHEVIMLYSSFMRPWGQGLLWSYAPQSDTVAVGITGGGVELEGKFKASPLNWSELQTDLLLAAQHTNHIYIFSLEGCVQQGFLQRLKDLHWQQPVQIPYEAAQRAENLRQMFQRALWLMARPAWILFGLALLVSLFTWLKRRAKVRR